MPERRARHRRRCLLPLAVVLEVLEPAGVLARHVQLGNHVAGVVAYPEVVTDVDPAVVKQRVVVGAQTEDLFGHIGTEMRFP
jgi:hypothetical protein